MQFPNPFKKEKPAEQAAEAPRIEPQLGGEGGEPSPWDVREDPPAFNVVGEEKPLVEPERAAEPVPESVQTPVYSPAAPAASADPVAPAPESAPRGSLFVEPKAPQPAAKIEPRLAPRAADAATRLVIGEIGSAPSPEAPRRPAPEPEAAAPAGDEEPTGKKRLRMPAFGFMKRKAAPLSDEVEDDVPDEEILVQRQRTRYRLVGAAALMLGVIVVSPLLLDREQDVKPPVSTEIPAVPETARTTLNALPGSSGDVDVTANGAAAEQSTSRANLANEARQPVKTEPAPKAEAAKPAPARRQARAQEGRGKACEEELRHGRQGLLRSGARDEQRAQCRKARQGAFRQGLSGLQGFGEPEGGHALARARGQLRDPRRGPWCSGYACARRPHGPAHRRQQSLGARRLVNA